MKEEKLKELIEKGKKNPLSNKELVELIQLIGPKDALDAFHKKE